MESSEITQAFLNLRFAHEMFVHSVFETQSGTIEEIYSSAMMLDEAFSMGLSVGAIANYRERLNSHIDVLVCSCAELTELEISFLSIAQDMYAATHDPYWDLAGSCTAFMY